MEAFPLRCVLNNYEQTDVAQMLIIPGKNKNLARRFYANFFDYFIVVGLTILFIRFGGEEFRSGAYRVTGLTMMVVPFFWWLYLPVCEGLFGQTIGKKALGLFVVDMQGRTPSIVHTTLRRVFDVVEFFTFGVGGMLTINYSKNNQRLGDYVAQTTVIRMDAVCKLCDGDVELSRNEAMFGSFTCPTCNAQNESPLKASGWF